MHNIIEATPFPWQHEQWKTLVARYQVQTFPHALLLTGAKGLGKKDFAQNVAKLLLCESLEYCQPCAACQLLASGNHPDLMQVELGEKEKSIHIDTIREILPQCYETAQRGKNKVVLILRADLLNPAACNALLKTLEEPERNTYFILVCDSLYQLPQTLRSRCQLLRFYAQNFPQTRDWLKAQVDANADIDAALYLTQGAPLEALHWLKEKRLENYQQIWQDAVELVVKKAEPISIAEKWQKLPVEVLLHALHWLWMLGLHNNASQLSEDPSMHVLHQSRQLLRQKKSRYQLGLDYKILLDFRKLVYQHASFNLNMQLTALCVRLVG